MKDVHAIPPDARRMPNQYHSPSPLATPTAAERMAVAMAMERPGVVRATMVFVSFMRVLFSILFLLVEEVALRNDAATNLLKNSKL